MRNFKVTDDYIVADECVGLNRDGDKVYRSSILLDRETFVEAYNKWILKEEEIGNDTIISNQTH